MHLETSNKTQLQNHIMERNPGIKTLVENGETFEFLFSYEVNERKSLILKCFSSIQSYLHENNDKIQIEYSLCKLYDRVHVMQCSKCCKLGHNKKRIVHTKILQINTLVQIAVAKIIKLIVTPTTHSHVIALTILRKNIESSQELIMATTHHYDIRTAIPIP